MARVHSIFFIVVMVVVVVAMVVMMTMMAVTIIAVFIIITVTFIMVVVMVVMDLFSCIDWHRLTMPATWERVTSLVITATSATINSHSYVVNRRRGKVVRVEQAEVVFLLNV